MTSCFRSVPRGARALVAASALLSVLPHVASAQASTTRGWSFGAQLEGTSLTVEQGEASSGGGLGLRAGYGFNRIVTAFLRVDGSQIDVTDGSAVVGQWGMAHADIGARFHFANSLRRWVPYVDVAVGARSVSVDDAAVDGESAGKISFNGGAFSLGGGLSIFFAKSWAFDTSLTFTGGQFSEVEVGNVSLRNLDLDASSVRFGVGVVWWP
jgi:hypothetical protein